MMGKDGQMVTFPYSTLQQVKKKHAFCLEGQLYEAIPRCLCGERQWRLFTT